MRPPKAAWRTRRRSGGVLLTGLVVVIAACAVTVAMAHDPKESKPPKQVFLLSLKPGPSWDKSKAIASQVGVADQTLYHDRLFVDGAILMGGQLADGQGMLVVLEVASLEDAQKIANDDPAVKSRVLVSDIRQWHPRLRRLPSKDPPPDMTHTAPSPSSCGGGR
jgi:hypothetical protein